jgi:hypothetical protein
VLILVWVTLGIFNFGALSLIVIVTGACFVNENWNASQDWLVFFFSKCCEYFSTNMYATSNSIPEGRGRGVRCRNEIHFSCYTLMFFFFFEKKSRAFFFRAKLVITVFVKFFVSGGKPELTPTHTCQFSQFFPGSCSFPVCSANSNGLSVREAHRHCVSVVTALAHLW